MIKVEVISDFTLKKFEELKNIERVGEDTKGKLNTGDKFVCTKEMADYLLGNNAYKKPYVKVIEVIPVETPKLKEEPIKVKPIKKKKSTK